ncbi:hypothetical protein GLW03_08295 [Halobacillus halophilus]|uniref:hypothetical protein n=1 Tax=Halobacillus halophilus TaxID=1570 RepID=UPI00136E5A60|nr:hypothetical protein [Halobacillus halophilus]MYL29818.1 hypothetical protein [Halobacillus halophilus]
MDLKEHLLTEGYNQIDILLVREGEDQTTVPGITLHKVTDLEYKLYLDPESITYHLKEEHPYFQGDQKVESGEMKQVKGYILEW